MSEVGPWELPQSWRWARLHEVTEISSDLRNPAETPHAVHIAPNHIESSTGRLIGYGTVTGDGVTSPKHAFRCGQILYSKIRPYLAKAVIADRDGLCSADMYPLSPREHVINTRFLHRWIVSPAFTSLASESQGRTVLPKINQAALNRKWVPLPPLAEQQRIADKLNALLARVDGCLGRLKRSSEQLDSLHEALLAAAVGGTLTRGWRDPNGAPEWRPVQLRDVASGFNYGTSAKSAKTGDVPVIRMGNIQNGRIVWADLVFTSDHSEIGKYRLTPGDVLFNRTNSPELVGKTAVFKGEREAIYAGYLIRVQCGPELLPDFLNYCLSSPAGRDYCWRVKSDGVSQSNINAHKLADFSFRLPSIPEQREIVRRVEAMLGSLSAAGERISRALAMLSGVTSSALASAFRGQLVPQDTKGEPTTPCLPSLASRTSRRSRPPRRSTRS